MEIEDLRAMMTVLSFAAFLAIVAWAYGSGRGERFSAAARLPFDEPGDEPVPSKPTQGGVKHTQGEL
jgi:cbb3-type cytochrome oxidase subunit 3